MFRALSLLLLTVTSVAAQESRSPWGGRQVGEAVVVSTTDGGILRGFVDARTTNSRLWLTAASDGVSITSVTPADAVVDVAAGVAEEWKVGLVADPSVVADPVVVARLGNGYDPRVASLQVVARAANWDSDANVDGVLAWVQPLDANGRLLPVEGSARCELQAYHINHRGEHLPLPTQQWQQPLTVESFGSDGAVIRVPLRQLADAVGEERPCVGVLKVRLLVPGAGVYDAVVGGLLL
ncbi:hypothetical protein [Posidoniimonas corsicana]|uniref:hypothetical protein n=1 Tax=Posidoniimonas corsicana TaxID=1938618 RepID=UPI0011B54220|nr:hypothetical protein [Posidoniimonas corsicana]